MAAFNDCVSATVHCTCSLHVSMRESTDHVCIYWHKMEQDDIDSIRAAMNEAQENLAKRKQDES